MCIRLNYPVIMTLGVDAVHVYANATYIAINITHASVIYDAGKHFLNIIFTNHFYVEAQRLRNHLFQVEGSLYHEKYLISHQILAANQR